MASHPSARMNAANPAPRPFPNAMTANRMPAGGPRRQSWRQMRAAVYNHPPSLVNEQYVDSSSTMAYSTSSRQSMMVQSSSDDAFFTSGAPENWRHTVCNSFKPMDPSLNQSQETPDDTVYPGGPACNMPPALNSVPQTFTNTSSPAGGEAVHVDDDNHSDSGSSLSDCAPGPSTIGAVDFEGSRSSYKRPAAIVANSSPIDIPTTSKATPAMYSRSIQTLPSYTNTNQSVPTVIVDSQSTDIPTNLPAAPSAIFSRSIQPVPSDTNHSAIVAESSPSVPASLSPAPARFPESNQSVASQTNDPVPTSSQAVQTDASFPIFSHLASIISQRSSQFVFDIFGKARNSIVHSEMQTDHPLLVDRDVMTDSPNSPSPISPVVQYEVASQTDSLVNVDQAPENEPLFVDTNAQTSDFEESNEELIAKIWQLTPARRNVVLRGCVEKSVENLTSSDDDEAQEVEQITAVRFDENGLQYRVRWYLSLMTVLTIVEFESELYRASVRRRDTWEPECNFLTGLDDFLKDFYKRCNLKKRRALDVASQHSSQVAFGQGKDTLCLVQLKKGNRGEKSSRL